MPLSNRTVAALAEAVNRGYSHTELDILFLRLDCVGADEVDTGVTGNKLDRARRAVQTLNGRTDGEPDAVALAREVLEVKYQGRIFDFQGNVVEHLMRLVESLRFDGFEFVDEKLVPTTPSPAALAPQITLLERELRRAGLDVPLTHYQQAIDSFIDGRREASNGQLRSFLEGFLTTLAGGTASRRTQDPRGAVEQLRTSGRIDGDEAKALTGLVGMSNERGAHPGLTDDEEALFRLHFTTSAARYILARLRL